jgi:hypothetical protein
MRRLMAAATLLVLLAIAPACRIKKKAKAAEDDGQPVSVLNVTDPRASLQLTRGFWGVENDSWRWTMKNFAVILRAPMGAAQKGARLQLRFTVPEVMYNRVGDMTLDAHVNGLDLGSEKYTKSGEAEYDRDIPATAISGDLISIDFSVDKGLAPTDRDPRELAIIVSMIGLLPK